MATLQELVGECKMALIQAAPRIVETQAQTQLALVTLRIQSQGLGAYHYSASLVPTYFFAPKALNAAGKTYVKKNKLGNWGGFRAAQGLPVDAVYLTYTGRMFRSLTTLYTGFSGAVYTARIVSADQESANKVQWNIARYGDFLAPTPSEAAEVNQVAQVEVQKIINQFFGNA